MSLPRQLSGDRAAKIAFVIGLSVIFYFYGVATYYFEVFPYQILRDARDAWQAWGKLEYDDTPMHLREYDLESNREALPRQLDARSGTEPILVTGGFYQKLDHCPSYGCIAWIMDRQGQIIHAWEVDPNLLLKGATGFSGPLDELNIGVSGIALAKDGTLIAILQTRNVFPYQAGIAKFDINGQIIWKRFDHSHHWPTVDANGDIYAPYATYDDEIEFLGETATDLRCDTGPIYMEGVRLLSNEGKVQKEYFLPDLIAKSDYPGLVYGLRDGCDPIHLNAIELVPASATSSTPGLNTGDLLLSLREPSALVTLDRKTGSIKHVSSGRFSGQHSPRFLPDGTVLLYDNLGGKRSWGGSRIVRLDLGSNEIEIIFPKGHEVDLLPFGSESGGTLSVSSDGRRVLAAEYTASRIIEIDIETGDPLWVYDQIINLESFVEERGLSKEWSRAQALALGAYYVDDLGFLDRP